MAEVTLQNGAVKSLTRLKYNKGPFHRTAREPTISTGSYIQLLFSRNIIKQVKRSYYYLTSCWNEMSEQQFTLASLMVLQSSGGICGLVHCKCA